MAVTEFPAPFSGVDVVVAAADRAQLKGHVDRLLTCGHDHHFAVAGLRLFVSANAPACLDLP